MTTTKLSNDYFENVVTEAVILPLLSLGIISSLGIGDIGFKRTLQLHCIEISSATDNEVKEKCMRYNMKLQQLGVIINQLFLMYFESSYAVAGVYYETDSGLVLAPPLPEMLDANLCALVVTNMQKEIEKKFASKLEKLFR